MNRLNFLTIFFLLISFQFHLLESAANDRSIVLTLQYHNSRMVSKIWDLHDFNAIPIFKNLLDDLPNQRSERLIFPLQQEHNHVTHTYLKNLITGNVAPHSLEQYLTDYNYFIGDKDINLGDNAYQTVKQKVFREHYDDFCRNLHNNLFRDFAWLDLNNFLQQRLGVNLASADMANFEFVNQIKFSHEDLIELIAPAITITNDIPENAGPFYRYSITVQSNRYIIIDSPALCNLIKLIEYQKYSTEWKKNNSSSNDNEEVLNKKLAYDLAFHFDENRTLFKTISLKNLFFKGLHLEPILANTNKISFENSNVTISDNDINTLQKLQKKNITKSARELVFSDIPFYLDDGKKYSLEMDFGTSHITNPDKLLDLIDVSNGYFQTILIKNVSINKTKLWFKQLLCRKLARVKFGMSLIVNTIILVKMFKTYGWFWKTGKYWGIFFFAIFGTIFSFASYFIQLYIYYHMIHFPENAAKELSQKTFNTNGGVTFKSNRFTQNT